MPILTIKRDTLYRSKAATKRATRTMTVDIYWAHLDVCIFDVDSVERILPSRIQTGDIGMPTVIW